MNKKELVSLLSGRIGLPLRRTAEILEQVLNTIAESALRDGRCMCGGHTFRLRSTRARTGRNPNTGEAIVIPARHIITYRRLMEEQTA